MKAKQALLGWLACAGLALGARAQSHDNAIPQHFTGVISEYSPSNVPGGPWEVRGKWTLDIHGGYADFAGAWRAYLERIDWTARSS